MLQAFREGLSWRQVQSTPSLTSVGGQGSLLEAGKAVPEASPWELSVEINLCPKAGMLCPMQEVRVELRLPGGKRWPHGRRKWAVPEWRVVQSEVRRLAWMCFRKSL